MNEIKILSDRIIIDGHADTKEQCETATMLANLLLAQGSGFNCVEYRNGYAEFKKNDAVKLADSELKFLRGPGSIDLYDSVTGDRILGVAADSTVTVTFNDKIISFTTGGGMHIDYANTTYVETYDTTELASVLTATLKKSITSITLRSGSYGEYDVVLRAAFDGKINITKSAGVVLKTQGKYCAEDITVVPTLEEKSVTPTESAQEIVPSNGKCGISKLTVGAVQTETKTITPTTSQQTFTPTSGKYFKQVICQAIQAYQGTATPTKSEQTINPTSGKFFSSFKVAPIPSEYIIPSGTLQITANGAKDVTNYKNVNVNVAPNLEQKTVTITENGTTEVTPTTGKDGMSKVTVTTNVPSSGGVEEVATASAMDALLVEANVGKYYKFTGTTDSNYTNGDIYLVEGGATLINFTIDGTAYQAEEGMTWQEWVNSSYNTYGCTIEGSSVKGKGNNGSPTYIYINQNSSLTLVSSTDSIIKNATYEDAAGGAGN